MLPWLQYNNKYNMRLAYSALIACVVSFLLFALMQFLTSVNVAKRYDIPPGATMQFIRLQHQSKTQLKQRQLPKKPEPAKQTPTRPLASQPKVSLRSIDKPHLSMPNVPEMAFSTRPYLGTLSSLTRDSELLPLVRVEPNYPRKAARRGTEGWVEVEFTVLEDGSVSAAKVVKAEPQRTFNREALRAIAKWKFSPKIVEGKPVRQTASQVIQFKLSKP